MSFLGGIWAKIIGLVVLVVGALGFKAVYDRNRRREGAREVTDKLNKQGEERDEKMRQAPKAETEDDVDKVLRDGRG